MVDLRECLVCPLCAGSDFSQLTPPGDVLQAVMCKACHFGIERTTSGDPGAAYTRQAYDETRERGEGLNAWKRFHHDVAVGHMRYLQFAAAIGSVGNMRRHYWIDIGCGNGGVLVAVRRNGWQITGVELEPAFASEVSKVIGAEVVSYETYLAHAMSGRMAGDVAPSVISFFDTLEHMFDPTAAVSLAAKRLINGGYLVIEVPDFDEVDGADFCKWKHRKINTDFTEHIWHFSERALRRLLRAHGIGDIVSVTRPVPGRLQVIWKNGAHDNDSHATRRTGISAIG